MEDKRAVASVLINVLNKTNSGKMTWQSNAQSTGFVSFLENFSVEVVPPNNNSILRYYASNSQLSDSLVFGGTYIYKPKPNEVKIIVSDLKTGNPIFEVSQSFFTSQDYARYNLTTEVFKNILNAAQSQLETKIGKEAERVLEDLENL